MGRRRTTRKNYTEDRIREAEVDDVKTNKWLRGTGLKARTKELIIAVQYQSLPTKSRYPRIVKDGTSSLCKICNRHRRGLISAEECVKGEVSSLSWYLKFSMGKLMEDVRMAGTL